MGTATDGEHEGLHEASMNVRTICVPSSDPAFARVVGRVLADRAVSSTGRLEQELRPLYPQARVRRRELDGEPEETWYVYRDRRFPTRPDEAG